MDDFDGTWYDEDAGPLVRPYAVTRGRTRATQDSIDLVTLVVALQPDARVQEPEYARILSLCRGPTTVAEISAVLDLPLGAVKVLVGDLIERNLVIFSSGRSSPGTDVLQAVLDGIRRL